MKRLLAYLVLVSCIANHSAFAKGALPNSDARLAVNSVAHEEQLSKTPKNQRGRWRWPLDNYGPTSITQDYSEYNACVDQNCTEYTGKHHTGIDVGAPQGTDVKAVADGWVVNYVPNGKPGCAKLLNDETSCRDHGDGNTIIVEHDHKHFSQYQHLQKPADNDPFIKKIMDNCRPYDETINGARIAGYACTKRDRIGVTLGQVVGHVGGTGFGKDDAWPYHLHFESKKFSTLNSPKDGTSFGYSLDHPFNLGYGDPVLNIEKTSRNDPSIHVRVSLAGDGVSFRIGPDTNYDRQTRGHHTDPNYPDGFSAIAYSKPTGGCDQGWDRIIAYGNFPPPESKYFDPTDVQWRGGPGQLPDVWVCIGNAGQTWVEVAP